MQKYLSLILVGILFLCSWCDMIIEDPKQDQTENQTWVQQSTEKKTKTKEYYDEKVKPYVDNAKKQITGQIEQIANDTKEAINEQIEKVNNSIDEALQKKSDQIREKVRWQMDNFKFN